MSYFRDKFGQEVIQHQSKLRRFLTELEANPPEQLDIYVEELDKEVWAETNCLTCSNCCRNMTPTFTVQDIRRIAAHFRMSAAAFKEKWLYQNKEGEWMNRNQPCQFLDLTTNRCSIYEIRPADCVGFPHLTKMKMVEYIHVHKQNVQHCPATFKMVEKLMHRLKEGPTENSDMPTENVPS